MVATMLLASILAVVLSTTHSPGLYIDLRLYRYSESGYVEETSSLGLRSDIVTCVHLGVVSPEYAKLLALRCFKRVPVLRIPYETVEKFIREWWDLLSSRKVPVRSIRSHEVGMIIRVHVVNVSSGEVLYRVLDSLQITLGDFEKPQVVYYVVRARRGIHQVQYEKRVLYTSAGTLLLRELASITEGALAGVQYYSYDYCDCTEYYCMCYKLLARATPDDLVQDLPGDYFKWSGVRYVKTPVLIAYNYYTGATIGTSINVGTQTGAVVARLTFTTGSIMSSIMGGTLPEVTLQAGGSTWGGKNYYYGLSFPVDSTTTARWAYIWARPVQEFWEVYECTPSAPSWYCRKVEEEVLAYVSDVLVEGATILGGSEVGLPHSTVMNSFLSGTNGVLLVIPETYLNDGVLLLGEYITLEHIVQYYDTCGADFEVGIPVGALFGLALCKALGLGTTTAACLTLVSFTAAFEVSLGYVSPGIYVSGNIYNLGGPGVLVYMWLSKYSYVHQPPWCPGYWCYCKYKVPAGVYFRFEPTPRPR